MHVLRLHTLNGMAFQHPAGTTRRSSLSAGAWNEYANYPANTNKNKMAQNGGNVCDFKGCGKIFRKAVRLEEHKRKHTGERPCVCPEEGCHKTFIRDVHLKRHMLSHSGAKDFSCVREGCTLTFSTKHYLKRHENRAHKGPFKCPYKDCEMEFTRCSFLKIHQNVHTKAKPYRCKERGCHECFDTPAKLRKHKRKHDQGLMCYFPRVRNDVFAHKWLKKHISSHKCALFCEC